jgi:uncharacterized sporulation protein YeaH/YhbH (DUF444 family)
MMTFTQEQIAEAREIRNAYARRWRRENAQRQKELQTAFWLSKKQELQEWMAKEEMRDDRTG